MTITLFTIPRSGTRCQYQEVLCVLRDGVDRPPAVAELAIELCEGLQGIYTSKNLPLPTVVICTSWGPTKWKHISHNFSGNCQASPLGSRPLMRAR